MSAKGIMCTCVRKNGSFWLPMVLHKLIELLSFSVINSWFGNCWRASLEMDPTLWKSSWASKALWIWIIAWMYQNIYLLVSIILFLLVDRDAWLWFMPLCIHAKVSNSCSLVSWDNCLWIFLTAHCLNELSLNLKMSNLYGTVTFRFNNIYYVLRIKRFTNNICIIGLEHCWEWMNFIDLNSTIYTGSILIVNL